MSAVFITGTGTGVGKTFVASGLIRYFRGLGQPVAALKPLVSGFDPAEHGLDALLDIFHKPGHLRTLREALERAS
ncbi:MAG: AAA family ATPase [Methylocella sp.]|nr:MAG: hypothetical protein DLM68_07915 [Hyphomicrobiales bacterium]